MVPIKLEFPLEEGESLSEALDEQRFAMVGYFVCFFLIMLVWENHVLLFGRLRLHDEAVAWFNLALLLLIGFLPYPLTLHGDYHQESVALVPAVLVVAVICVLQAVMLWYTNRQQEQLDPAYAVQVRGHTPPMLLRVFAKLAIFLLAYAISTASPVGGFVVIALLPLAPLFCKWADRHVFRLDAPLAALLAGEVGQERMAGGGGIRPLWYPEA